jgi:hypothetical protein
MPLAAVGWANTALVKRLSDFSQRSCTCFSDRVKGGQDAGGERARCLSLDSASGHAGLIQIDRIAELSARRPLRLQSSPRPLRDQPSLFLGQRREQVKHKGIGIPPELRNDERYPLGH